MAERQWSGSTLADRQSARRRALLDAGLDLLGAEGGPAVGVRAVCRRARLTERYFYENFRDRDALVAAVYDEVTERAHAALAGAVASATGDVSALVEAAVAAFVELVLDDPRVGRALLLAPLTDPALMHRGTAALPAFRALISEQLPPDADDVERRMTAIGLVGALAQLFGAALDGSLVVPRERLVRHCVQLVLRASTPDR
ncbi:TetR/AcrR family transcriptional regulator [Pseudonocardia sp. CA-107938]|uniref:TetR/AcrR family transcriptional regulator n=1 Tax=Pseudonocardia sp. CA-107938 TaxID=3240021 RepID=UPI003D94A67C